MAAKGYFDALVKLGELASDSQGSKELGEYDIFRKCIFFEDHKGESEGDSCRAIPNRVRVS